MNATQFNDPRIRGLFYQGLLIAVLGALLIGGAYNAYVNMAARGIPMGFGFWNEVAGFDINLHLIPYSATSTYGQAFWVGLLNTLLVAAIGIPLATLLGFAVGVARLSPNWLLSRVRAALHHDIAQYAAAAAIAVLVQRCPEIAARTAPVAVSWRLDLSQQSGVVPPGAGSARRRVGICRCVRRSRRRGDRVSRLGAAPTGA